MYSHEIEDYLRKNNRELTPLEFMGVINSSPQVVNVEFNEDNTFTFKTTDGFSMNFRLLEEPKKLQLKRDK